ncbi:TPA: hypothetical protein ACQN8E_001711, partial [Streptococcus pyogenes]
LKSYSSSNFTTFLVDSEMYGKYITEVFKNIIPKITKDWSPGSSLSQFPHCHKIGNDRANDKYCRAIENIHGISTEQLELWQFGFTGEVRLIAHLSGNDTIYPLLIDYHHLGYDSVKHNEKDTRHYKFCPIEKYIK